VSTLILDDDLRAKLNGLDGWVQVREPGGKPVGTFLPQDELLRLLYAEAHREASTPEALARQEAARAEYLAGGGVPMAVAVARAKAAAGLSDLP
jgi:hypothetical protein